MAMTVLKCSILLYIRSRKLSSPENRDMPLAARLSSLVVVGVANKLALEFVPVDHPHMSVPVVVAVVEGAEHVGTSEGLTIWTASTLILVELKQFRSLTSGTSDRSSVKTMSAHLAWLHVSITENARAKSDIILTLYSAAPDFRVCMI